MTKRSKKQLAPAPSVDLVALAEYVERFSTKTIVVLGDCDVAYQASCEQEGCCQRGRRQVS